jgi:spore germination protein
MILHVVSPGETLFSIAGRYNVPPLWLGRQNLLPGDGALAVGQTLVVLTPAQVHTVAPGETLSSIAARYGVSELTLYRNNFFLGGRPDLRSGEQLAITLADPPVQPLAVSGYAYPFINPDTRDQVLPFLSDLIPFTHGIGPDGNLLPPADQALRQAALPFGVRLWLHLSTLTEGGTFSTQRAEEVLTDPARQQRLIDDLRVALESGGYSGVDVDFEFVRGELAGAYAAFVRRLRQALSGTPVAVALAPKTSADQPGLLYEAHDYAALGEAADMVLLMTYEWGYTYGPPMAVAPLPQVRRVLDYALSVIPPEKILLGVPLYGYDWPLPYERGVTRGRSLSPLEAVALARETGSEILFDPEAQAPWFRYTAPDGRPHEVWFEDGRSARAKLDLAGENGLRGVGLWSADRRCSQFYLALRGLYAIGGA